ncbi:hypothetical protein JCM10449v2_006989 [Rhodotorula kratochvilovae]
MRTTSSILSVAAFAAVVRAGGIIDNAIQAAKLAASASTLNGAGSYIFTNVKTGKTLSFARNSGTTDFFPADDGGAVEVQFFGTAARISGGNNKCASAQWSYDVEGGVDHAAVSYACKVGSGLLTGTASLEETKQWWYIVPAGTTSDAEDSAPADTSADDSSDSTANTSDAVVFAASSKAKTAAAKVVSSPAAPSAPSTPAPASSPAASSSSDSSVSDKQAEYNELGYWTSSSSSVSLKGVDTSNVNSKDRTTWVCRHPGWWLANHPAYITKAGHVECASDLKAYLADQKSGRMVRRSRPSHAEMAQNLVKKGQQTYHIIAVDHILDMATRAIAHEAIPTVGGYTSTKLSLWNQSNDGQLWTITAA